MSLLPCSSCSRHVHAHESTCPFCYATLTPAPLAAGTERRSAAPLRLGRAALLALGTSAAALGACGRDETPTQKVEPPPKPEEVPAPVYGGPPPPLPDPATPDAAPQQLLPRDAGPKPLTNGHPAPMYGGPPSKTK